MPGAVLKMMESRSISILLIFLSRCIIVTIVAFKDDLNLNFVLLSNDSIFGKQAMIVPCLFNIFMFLPKCKFLKYYILSNRCLCTLALEIFAAGRETLIIMYIGCHASNSSIGLTQVLDQALFPEISRGS